GRRGRQARRRGSTRSHPRCRSPDRSSRGGRWSTPNPSRGRRSRQQSPQCDRVSCRDLRVARMHAVTDVPTPAHHDVTDRRSQWPEDRAVEQRVPVLSDGIGLIQDDPIGPMAGGDGADSLSRCLCPAAAGSAIETASERFGAGEPEYVALLVLDALPVFEKTQLEKRIDVDMAVAADAETAIARKKGLGAEQAIAKIAFRRRTQAGDGPPSHQG